MLASKIYLISSYINMLLTILFAIPSIQFVLDWYAGFELDINIEMVLKLGFIALLLLINKLVRVVSYIDLLVIIFKGNNKDLIESLIDIKLRLAPYAVLKLIGALVVVYWDAFMGSLILVAGCIDIWTGLLGIAIITKLNNRGYSINKIHYLYQMFAISDIYSTLKIVKGERNSDE